MNDYLPFLLTLLFSMAAVVSSKRIFLGNVVDVPIFWHSATGRFIETALGLIAFSIAITSFIFCYQKIAWWFIIVAYLGVSIVVHLLPFMQIKSSNHIFTPVIALQLYTPLSCMALFWMVQVW